MLIFIISFFTILIIKLYVSFLRLVRSREPLLVPWPLPPHFTAQCEDTKLATLW